MRIQIRLPKARKCRSVPSKLLNVVACHKEECHDAVRHSLGLWGYFLRGVYDLRVR